MAREDTGRFPTMLRARAEERSQRCECRAAAREDEVRRTAAVDQRAEIDGIATQVLVATPDGGQDGARSGEVPEMRVSEERRLGHTAGDQHDVVGGRAERAHLAGVGDAVAQVGLGVGEDEAVALARETPQRREPLAVPPGDPVGCTVRLADRGQVHHTRYRVRPPENADADGPERQPRDEGGRPVDRIDDDPARPPARADRPLLAENSDIREARHERVDEIPLDLAIRLRDQRPVRLPFGRHSPEAGEGERPGSLRHRLQLVAGRDLHGTVHRTQRLRLTVPGGAGDAARPCGTGCALWGSGRPSTDGGAASRTGANFSSPARRSSPPVAMRAYRRTSSTASPPTPTIATTRPAWRRPSAVRSSGSRAWCGTVGAAACVRRWRTRPRRSTPARRAAW